MAPPMARSAALRGIEERHQTSCRSRDGRRCGCSPSYRAKVYDKTNRVYRKSRWLSNLVDARAWRVEAERAVRLGSFSTTSHTVREAAQRFFKGMKDGSVRNRSGRPFKASAIRSYETSFR